MYKKRYQSWRKHIDFLLLDLLCVHLSYLICCFLAAKEKPYGNSVVNNGLLVATIIDAATIVFYQTFRNVIQRDVYKEISITVKHSVILALSLIICMYITNTVDYYSKYFLLFIWAIYMVVTFIARCF